MCDAHNQPTTAKLDAFELDALPVKRTTQRADLRAVNFEFPISRLSEALHYVATLIEPVGLHLHATAQWANDTETQCCATAWTRASDAQWHNYCVAFEQDCVALVDRLTDKAPIIGLPVGKTVGPTPWEFNPHYFIHPTAPRHIEG
jgi:hypothetical protein